MSGLIRNYSYFGAGDFFSPGRWLDRLFHPYRYAHACNYQGKLLLVRMTNRAQRALDTLESPLLVEMQLYFSCVVKKRVIFHTPINIPDASMQAVNEKLSIVMHAVQADSCDPVEFARHYPARRILESPASRAMRARQLDIDYRDGHWQGEFTV